MPLTELDFAKPNNEPMLVAVTGEEISSNPPPSSDGEIIAGFSTIYLLTRIGEELASYTPGAFNIIMVGGVNKVGGFFHSTLGAQFVNIETGAIVAGPFNLAAFDASATFLRVIGTRTNGGFYYIVETVGLQVVIGTIDPDYTINPGNTFTRYNLTGTGLASDTQLILANMTNADFQLIDLVAGTSTPGTFSSGRAAFSTDNDNSGINTGNTFIRPVNVGGNDLSLEESDLTGNLIRTETIINGIDPLTTFLSPIGFFPDKIIIGLTDGVTYLVVKEILLPSWTIEDITSEWNTNQPDPVQVLLAGSNFTV